MEVIGADGAHVGTVDKVEGGRIKLTKKDSGEGSHKGHHHFIEKGLIAGVEGNKVRLSANGGCRGDDGRREIGSLLLRLYPRDFLDSDSFFENELASYPEPAVQQYGKSASTAGEQRKLGLKHYATPPDQHLILT
jgi:hypothetical protein